MQIQPYVSTTSWASTYAQDVFVPLSPDERTWLAEKHGAEAVNLTKLARKLLLTGYSPQDPSHRKMVKKWMEMGATP